MRMPALSFQLAARIVAAVLGLALIVLGCAAHRQPKAGDKYQAAWACTWDATDAKTGKPSEMHCLAPDGTRYKVRAE